MPDMLQALFPAMLGILSGLLTLALVLWAMPQRVGAGGAGLPARVDGDVLSEPRRFVFREGYLVDHSPNVSFLLPPPIDHLRAWDRLADSLGDVADGIVPAFEALRRTGRPFRLEGELGADRILVIGSREGDDLRITVSAAECRQSAIRVDLESLRALEADAGLVARAGDTAPTLSWALDAGGTIVWANAAYHALVKRCLPPGQAESWPVPDLFPDQPGAPAGTTRRKLEARDGTELWFDIVASAPGADGLRFMHGISLDAVVRAETQLRTFIQTLTKSFAVLPTGLAIFDGHGQLALFNPALMDMTGLDAGFLSRRPKMAEFFDALRDRQQLPEPRDYKAWRQSLSDMSRVDGTGVYVETWTLPSGTTYRVTGRPQPDGAVTLMMEDVTADISETRRARRDRQVMEALLDSVDEALAVFARDGSCVLANALAAKGGPGGEGPAVPAKALTLSTFVERWSRSCTPSGAWSEIRDMLRRPPRDREGWSERLHRDAGDDLALKVTPLPGDLLAVGLAEAPAAFDALPAARGHGARQARA